MIDGVGVYGFVLHYSLLFAFFGSAFTVFLYLWRKKRLDMDEEAKYSMFDEEE
ncbi:MAG: hypothetical protein S4CHLAM2_05220 [Chlamydiales bacterium]|nr:hypothetical protein [Chlamydiales bacterium]